MRKFSKRHPRILFCGKLVPILCVVIGLLLPPMGACRCECCPAKDARSDEDRGDVSKKSCCCSDKKGDTGKIDKERSTEKTGCSSKQFGKKSCCSDLCRCCETNPDGSTVPCNCEILGVNEFYAVEKQQERPVFQPIFDSAFSDFLHRDPSPFELIHAEPAPSQLRLHLILCVQRN